MTCIDTEKLEETLNPELQELRNKASKTEEDLRAEIEALKRYINICKKEAIFIMEGFDIPLPEEDIRTALMELSALVAHYKKRI